MRRALTYLLVLTVSIVPGMAAGPEGAVQKPAASDEALRLKHVEISRDGQVTGQYLTPEGVPLAGKTLIVRTGTDEQKIVTDAAGRFVIRNAKTGRCIITAGEYVFACRLWDYGTAPEKALRSIAVVNGKDAVVRGNPIRNTVARLQSLSTTQQIALGLLVAAGTTVAIVESVEDGS